MSVNINIDFYIFYLHIDTQNQQNPQDSAYNSHLPKKNIYTLLELSFKKFPSLCSVNSDCKTFQHQNYTSTLHKFPYTVTFYFHVLKRWPKASGVIPMPWPLPALNIRPDLHAVAEGERRPAVWIDRCIIHKPVEQLLIEIHWQLHRLAKPRKEAAENVILDSPFPALFLGCPSGSQNRYMCLRTRHIFLQ